ncbi:MAG: hypothetical protein BWY76_01986 [bacterium ADurb.Bin429]|nr:MAG: hypothetical protein BWY76_01986 [bacterium ADurb.Bin429]
MTTNLILSGKYAELLPVVLIAHVLEIVNILGENRQEAHDVTFTCTIVTDDENAFAFSTAVEIKLRQRDIGDHLVER